MKYLDLVAIYDPSCVFSTPRGNQSGGHPSEREGGQASGQTGIRQRFSAVSITSRNNHPGERNE